MAATRSIASLGRSRRLILSFDINQLLSRSKQAGGCNGHQVTLVTPAYAMTDFNIARDGWIAAVYLFFDKLP